MVSVIIVTFNAGDLLQRCLRALLDSSLPLEVILVDNGSGDGSIHALRRAGLAEGITIVENFANLGFARAVNQGLARARGDYLLLLNPDCVVEPTTIARVCEALAADPEAGMAGCLLRNADGSEQPGCRRLVPTPGRSLVRVLHLDRWFPSLRSRGVMLNETPLPTAPVAVEAISGAFMLVRRAALETVGPMDEEYFMHCEDLDWCLRFREQGWKILFVPGASALHHKGVCSRSRPIRVEWHKHRGMMRFYRKHFRQRYPGWMMALVNVGVWFRFQALALGLLAKRLW